MNAQSKGYRYEEIAQKIERMIHNGTLKPGDKAPSTRALKTQERVSISTVLNAYYLLERKGIIESKPQSGFYVKSQELSLLPEPRVADIVLHERAVTTSDMVIQICQDNFGKAHLPLGTASPGKLIMRSPSMQRLGSSILRREKDLNTNYDAFPGCAPLRKQIAKRMFSYGVALAPDEIATTAGTAEALTLALRAVTKQGDLVAIESPTFFIVLQALELLGLRAIEIPASSQSGIDLSVLETAVKKHKIKACVVLSNFHNPLGAVIPERNKRKILKILERKDIPLIEDDVYGDLAFGVERPRPIKAFDKKGSVLYCSSFSKTLGAGYRVGWIVPGRYQKTVERLKLVTNVATSSFPQKLIAEYLQHGGYDRHVRRLSRIFMEQTHRMQSAIANYFPKGTRVSRPQGGFLLWIELPKQLNTLELYPRLLQEGISISPGPLFSPSGRFKNCLRLSCGLDWSPEVDRALQKIGEICALEL